VLNLAKHNLLLMIHLLLSDPYLARTLDSVRDFTKVSHLALLYFAQCHASSQTARWLRLKCDGTRSETRFRLSAKWMSPFKSVGAPVQPTTGSRGVRISGSTGGYTMFLDCVRVLATRSFASFSFTSPPVRHRVPSYFNWTLLNTSTLGSSFLYQKKSSSAVYRDDDLR
jgi:hypothetical protein